MEQLLRRESLTFFFPEKKTELYQDKKNANVVRAYLHNDREDNLDRRK